MTIPIALTIAGSDSSGGAGIQADLKTFAALGVYGASVITALTAQNTRGVSGIHPVPPAFVTAQIDAVFGDLEVKAVKIGMVAQLAAIEAIAAALGKSEVRAGGDIIFRVADGAAILQLNRPAKRNALSQAMWEAICAALAEAADRPDVRAFVFTGLPGVFCAGADLTALKSGDREAAARYREISLRGYAAVRDFSLPTVAVIDGLCIGGGNNLALACDIRLASPRASFAIPAVRHGIVYDRPTVTRLVELMGSGRASHLLFTAGRIDAARAAETGLVDILTEDLDAELADFLDALRAADMPTLLAIRDTIRQVR